MDPDVTLVNARAALQLAEQASNSEKQRKYLVIAVRAYESLDEWMSDGGMLPVAWRKPGP